MTSSNHHAIGDVVTSVGGPTGPLGQSDLNNTSKLSGPTTFNVVYYGNELCSSGGENKEELGRISLPAAYGRGNSCANSRGIILQC